MNALKLRLMIKATAIRINAGEDLETILASWPALTDADKDQIRAGISEA